MFKFRRSDSIEEVAVTISTETFIRLALLTFISIIIFLAAKKAEHALTLIFVAFFFALALNAPVNWVSKHLPGRIKGSRALATSLSYLLVVIILVGLLAAIVPPLVKQTENLIKAAPHLISEFRNQNSAVGKFIRHHHLQSAIANFSHQLSSRLNNISGSAFSTAKQIGSSIFSILTILVITFMMLVEGPRWISFFKEIVPTRHHVLAERMANDMYRVIRGFINGQVILAALASLLIMPAVLLLHIGFPAGIAVVIFICGLIPLVGHTIGATIVTIIALFHSVTAAIIILAYYWFYIGVENYIIQPRIQSNTTNMSPLLVFVSVVIGVSFGGLLGGLVAIPVAGCIRIAILEYLYSKRIISGPEYTESTTETK